MPDERDVRLVHCLGRHKVKPRIVSKGQARVRWQEADALAHPLHMSIDWHERHAEAEQHDD